MTALLPCPWCGAAPVLSAEPGDGLDRLPAARVFCPRRCLGAMAWSIAASETPEALAAAAARATARWNARPAERSAAA